MDAPETDRFRKALPHFINVYRVPDAKSFQANFARHKARALEWYRIQCQLTAEDWVLHLDEETELDDFAIQTCIDFIERGSEDIGMVGLECTPYCPTMLTLPRAPFSTMVVTTGRTR